MIVRLHKAWNMCHIIQLTKYDSYCMTHTVWVIHKMYDITHWASCEWNKWTSLVINQIITNFALHHKITVNAAEIASVISLCYRILKNFLGHLSYESSGIFRIHNLYTFWFNEFIFEDKVTHSVVDLKINCTT